MKRFFGRKVAAPPAPTLAETSERLNNRSIQMDRQITELNRKIQALAAEMKKPQNKGRIPQLKRQAMDLIKRRKVLESQQGRIDGQRFNVDQMSFQQEQIQTNIDTVNCMKATNETLKKQMTKISIEGVDDVMMDMEDMMDEVNEISNILGGQIGEGFDEGELDAEFEALAFYDDEAPVSLDTGAAPQAAEADEDEIFAQQYMKQFMK